MPLNPINVGAVPNDNSGDTLRGAFIKVNQNEAYLDQKAPNAHTHPLSDLTQSGAAAGNVPTWNGTAWVPQVPPGAASGTVTSVGISLPDVFTVSNSPVTTSGVLTATFASQNAGVVLAAPSGANGTPSFRALVANDIPALSYESAGAVAAHASLTSGAHGMSVYGAELVTSGSSSAARAKLELGTASTKNVPASGNASETEAVLGSDTRLTNSRTPTAHTHAWTDIVSGTPTTLSGYGITDGVTTDGTGATGTWGINISGSAKRISDAAGTLRLANPSGASYAASDEFVAGMIKIRFPASSAGKESRVKLTIHIITDDRDDIAIERKSETIFVSGFTDATGSLSGITATTTRVNGGQRPVRSGKDSTGPCLWIGEGGATSWQRLSVAVTEVQVAGPDATDSNYGTGWSVSLASATDTVSETLTLYSLTTTETAAAKSHAHGNITNAGAIGSTANLPLITSTSGVITTGAFGSSANTFCQGNDARLSDARTPTAHTHTLGNLTQSGATSGQVATWNGTAWTPTTLPAGNPGTVTSVGLSLPSIFTVSNSPVTGSGTLTGALAVQTAGTVFAAPTENNAAPSFRALVATDIPSLNYEPSGAVAAHAELTDTAHGMTVYGANFVTSADAAAARTKLSLGTSATLNVPATGNATASQVVLGSDTRLTDARTPVAHVHAASDVTSGTFDIGRIPTGSTDSTVCIGNDARLSDARAPLSHTHGNITNAGAIGSTANLPLITTASGVITTGTFGSAENTFCQGNDSRLSDARTPVAHTHTLGDLTQSGATSGQVVSWNGTAWAPANVAASQNTFSTFAVSGQSNIVADSTSDTLTLVAGTNVTITTNATNGSITIAASGGSGGGGNVTGPSSTITDNSLVRWNQVNTAIQGSNVTLSDTGDMSSVNSLEFLSGASGDPGVGKLIWNDTERTLSLGIGDSGTTSYLGTDLHVLARNQTGSTIERGKVVRVNGASSGNITVALALGTSDAGTASTIGISSDSIGNTQTGMVITHGLIRGLNTGTWTAGDVLYISPTTAGNLTNVKPTAPNHAVRIGYVAYAHNSNGIIYVAVNNGYELDELHDVAYPTTPATNDFLVYGTDRWENKTPENTRTALGLGTLATQSGTFSGTSSGTNTGDQTITLTGDVTGTGTGSFDATIGNGKVTYAKIQNVSATNKVLGRSSIGAGVVQEIDCTAAGRAIIGAADVASQRTILELASIATSGSAADLSGTLSAARLPAFTGDVTTTAGTSATTIGANKVQYSMIQQVAGLSVIGNGGSSTANSAAITGTAGQVLRVNDGGTALAFGAVSLSTAASITGTLGVANGGTGITSFGTGIATWLETPSSANLANAITDETGTGSLVFANSPTLAGTPTSTTAAADTNTTQIATTAYVLGQASAATPAALGTAAVGTSLKYARADHVHALPTISLATGVSDTLPIANGGTGQTTQTAAFDALAPTTTKGDIIVSNGSDNVRLAVGATDGHVLTVDSTAATGVKWAAATGGGGGGGGSTNVWIPAAQWIPRTTNGCGIDSREQATGNINTDELLFDPAAIEYAQAIVVMPNNYNNSTFTARFYWTASAGTASTDIVWNVRARAFGDNIAIGQAFSATAATVTDTFFSANQMHVSAATGAVTVDGTAAANKSIIIEIYRNATSGSDTLSSDARFLGLEISYTAS